MLFLAQDLPEDGIRPGRMYNDAQQESLRTVYAEFEKAAGSKAVKRLNSHVTLMHESWINNTDVDVLNVYQEIWDKFGAMVRQSYRFPLGLFLPLFSQSIDLSCVLCIRAFCGN